MSRARCALLATLALAGCMGPAPREHFYTLSIPPAALTGAARSAAADALPRRAAITRLSLPEVVDRREMVVRIDANRVRIEDFHRWAEPLREGVARVLAGSLERELGGTWLVARERSPGPAPEMRISVDIRRFDALPGRAVALEAHWSVTGKTGEPRSGRSHIEEPVQGGDHAAIAAAFSRALASLAREMAAAGRPAGL